MRFTAGTTLHLPSVLSVARVDPAATVLHLAVACMTLLSSLQRAIPLILPIATGVLLQPPALTQIEITPPLHHQPR